MANAADWGTRSRATFAGAADPKKLSAAVVTFHATLDGVIAASIAGHRVPIACSRGCHYCCSLQVEVQPAETFTLAAWLRRHFSPERLAAVMEKLRANAASTREAGIEARKRMNIPCALLGDDGACTAYEARPSQCRKFNSTKLETCTASYARPDDDAIESPEHPAVAHNAAVIITQARHALRAANLDDTPADMNLALLAALEGSVAERRWRAGKKPFTK